MIITRTPMRISFLEEAQILKNFIRNMAERFCPHLSINIVTLQCVICRVFLIMSQSSVTVILSVSAVRMISVIH